MSCQSKKKKKKKKTQNVSEMIVYIHVVSTLKLKSQVAYAKTCLKPYANNKVADQPAHPRSLISTFVVRCLDSMICILAISKVSRF